VTSKSCSICRWKTANQTPVNMAVARVIGQVTSVQTLFSNWGSCTHYGWGNTTAWLNYCDQHSPHWDNEHIFQEARKIVSQPYITSLTLSGCQRCSRKTTPGGTGLNYWMKCTVKPTMRPPTRAAAITLRPQYYRLLIPR